MKPRKLVSVSMVALLGVAGAATSQNINPDISVIGDTRLWVTNDASDPKEGRLQIELKSAEFAFQGYLNPYVRADVFAGYHEGSFELEEAYATFLRGLPLGLQSKVGRYRVDFGKLNTLHPHAYSFLDTPLVHQEYLGHEGLADVGVNLNGQVPIGTSVLTLSGNLLKGDFAEGGHEHDEGGGEAHAEEDEPVETDLGYSERISLFVGTGAYAGIEIGANALQGTLDRLTGRHVRLIGADVKYRWAPNRYRSLTLQGEVIRSSRDVLHHHHHGEESDEEPAETERVTGIGFYAFADYRFAQRWNAGAIVERCDSPEEEDVTTGRFGFFGGFQVMEETTLLRLLVRRTDGDEIASPYWDATFQVVFSLGPHKAHWF